MINRSPVRPDKGWPARRRAIRHQTTRSTLSTAAALLALALSAADAAARQDARKMACNDVRELVFSAGAIVITTGDRLFERFVESQRFCQPVDEISVPAFVETRDNPQCWIGYVCRNRDDVEGGNQR